MFGFCLFACLFRGGSLVWLVLFEGLFCLFDCFLLFCFGWLAFGLVWFDLGLFDLDLFGIFLSSGSLLEFPSFFFLVLLPIPPAFLDLPQKIFHCPVLSPLIVLALN